MCGICGIVQFDKPHISKPLLHRMTQSLQHRGPDASDVFIAPHVGLGHTRLSIIDQSIAGAQPMRTEDGRWVLTYNGELYGAEKLRSQLRATGVHFRGRSDSEVLLRAWDLWGQACLEQLNGMFAFATWDAQNERLTLVRDRLGIKPLYWHRLKDGLIFASEIKGILASKRVSKRMNLHAVGEYFYHGNALGTHTFFQGIHVLEPGSTLVFDRTGVSIKPFWRVNPASIQPTTKTEAIGEIRRLLERSVQKQLVSDTSVGVFLSGGMDSSSIAALANRHYAGTLSTYTVGFDQPDGCDERKTAGRFARMLGTNHHEVHMDGKQLPEILEDITRSYDQPFAAAANVPLYLLTKQLSGSPKVVLLGEGGDELFAGYHRYTYMQRHRLLRFLAICAWPLRNQLPHAYQKARIQRLLYAFRQPDFALRMALMVNPEDPRNPPTRILGHAFRQLVEPHDPFSQYRQVHANLENLNPLTQMLLTDLQIILPSLYLEKVDRATMAHGIEARVPFLDNDLTEYALSLPTAMKLHGTRTKHLLREAFADLLPDFILNGPKRGFEVPRSSWLKGPLSDYMKETFTHKNIQEMDIFHQPTLALIINEHLTGAPGLGHLLWKALNFALWLRIYQPEIPHAIKIDSDIEAPIALSETH